MIARIPGFKGARAQVKTLKNINSNPRTLELSNPLVKGVNNKGFTLIEIIILIVMAGILLPAIVAPFVTGVRGSGKPEMVNRAMYLGQQRMEELMKYIYTNGALAPTGGFVAFPTGVPNYSGQNEIVYVNSNLSTPSGDVGYKRITVRVTDPNGDTYNVYSVATNFP